MFSPIIQFNFVVLIECKKTSFDSFVQEFSFSCIGCYYQMGTAKAARVISATQDLHSKDKQLIPGS